MAKASRIHPSVPLVDEVKRQQIERVTIVGKMKDLKQVIEWLHLRDFQIVQSGPYTTREMFPREDVDRFKFVAEREI